jgi:hypothetical protein
MTPKYLNSTALESPLSEMQSSLAGVDDAMQSSQSQIVTSSMQPPPVPAVPPVSIPLQQRQQSSPISPDNSAPGSPSQEDARRALEIVMNFFEHQPSGFVEPQEYVMIGKLMEKLKLQRNGEHLPGGMHRIPEQEYGVRKVE